MPRDKVRLYQFLIRPLDTQTLPDVAAPRGACSLRLGINPAIMRLWPRANSARRCQHRLRDRPGRRTHGTL